MIIYMLFFLYIRKSPSRQLSRSMTDFSSDPLKCSKISARVTCKAFTFLLFSFYIAMLSKSEDNKYFHLTKLTYPIFVLKPIE